ncbi:hypothetical protein LAZ67_8002356 [Cordylochernes scorpioides]|uniref:Uncharacterized protein n=1 Tax=Cordylochernes scorpioides TaxID=51811 RepID=A0ABY6KRC3_9ARAC|nr:hypothetical protein LAZ67_8002356 [Cordylochernes scorpioides]
MKRKPVSRLILLIFLLCWPLAVLVVWQFHAPSPHILRHPFYNYNVTAQEPQDPQQICLLPRYHPFDPSVLPYLNAPRPRLSCRVRQPNLTFVDTDAYGDAVMSRRRVFEWYKHFKEGRKETADNERSGRPSTSTTPEKVDKVLELVREDRRITVREVAEEAGISFGSTQSIVKEILGVTRLNAVLAIEGSDQAETAGAVEEQVVDPPTR